jgi:hypothetical protein
MKTIVCIFVWLLVPIAFLSVCYDVAKEFVEQNLKAKLKEKNGG